MQEELHYHLEREAEKYREQGSSSDTALRRARLAMGGPEQVRQQCRDARGTRLIEDLLQDLYFAVRQLRKNFPDFALHRNLRNLCSGYRREHGNLRLCGRGVGEEATTAYRDATRLVALL